MTSPSHPLERKFNASAADILEAIEHGFRAQVDVKGKLAELYLHRHLRRLEAKGQILSIVWHDADGQPDFEIKIRDGRSFALNLRIYGATRTSLPNGAVRSRFRRPAVGETRRDGKPEVT